MALTIEQILDAIAPKFASDANKQDHISLARLRTSTTCFGNKYNYAVALRAAHTLTLTSNTNIGTGSSGSISSIREGDVSISYGSRGTSTGSDLDNTSFGQELQQLIKSNIVGVSITGNTSIPCGDNDV